MTVPHDQGVFFVCVCTCPKVKESEREVADEAPSHLRIVHSSHSFTRGWVEERKGVCLCGLCWGERESHIKVRCSLQCLYNDQGDNRLEGGSEDENLSLFVCVFGQLVLQYRVLCMCSSLIPFCVRHNTRYTQHLELTSLTTTLCIVL